MVSNIRRKISTLILAMPNNIIRLQAYDYEDWLVKYQERRGKDLQKLSKRDNIKLTGPYQPIDSTLWALVTLASGNTVIISSSIYNRDTVLWSTLGDVKYIRSTKECEEPIVVEFDDQCYNNSLKQLLLDTLNKK